MICSASYTITVVADGVDGRSVKSITAYYAKNNSNTEAPTSGWSPSGISPTPTERFLWYKEVTVYSDSTEDLESNPVVIGVYGEKGDEGKSAALFFAWSKSEKIFTPQSANFWISGESFIYFNNSLMGNIPFASSWVNNWEEIQKAKTYEYCYLWCKTSEDGTPFLFTGASGKNAINVELSYYSFNLPCTDEGNINGSGIVDTVTVTQGSEIFTAVSPSATLDKKQFKLSVDLTDINNIDVDSSNYSVIKGTETSVMDADSATITIKVDYKDTEGIEGRVTKCVTVIRYVNTTIIKDIKTEIQTNKNNIKLGVLRMKTKDNGSYATDENGNVLVETVAGITVGVVEGADGWPKLSGYINLNADQIVTKGSIKADQLDANSVTADKLKSDCISGKSFLVGNGGSIRSSVYDENGNNNTGKEGFYLNSAGLLKAVNAYFTDINIVGGEIKGVNNPLNTLVNPEVGANYTAISYDSSAVKHKNSEIIEWLKNNSSIYTDFLTDDEITNGGDSITWNGETFTKVARFSSSCTKHQKNVDGSAYKKQNNLLFVKFAGSFINGPNSDFGISNNYDLYGKEVNLYVYNGTKSEYASGKYDIIYQTMLESASGVVMTPRLLYGGYGSAALDYFSNHSGRPYPTLSTPAKVTYQPFLSSIYGSSSGIDLYYPANISSTSSAYTKTITFTMEASADLVYSPDDVYLFHHTSSGMIYGGSISSNEYLSESEFSATLSSGATSSSLPLHAPFVGIQDNDGNSIATGSVISIKDLKINGTSYGEGVITVNENEFSFYDSANSLISTFVKGTYYPITNFPSISFTSVSRLKGVYVDDLFPKLDNNNKYSNDNNGGNIGSSSQPFNTVHSNSVYATNLYGTLNGDSSGTHIGNVNSDSTKNDYQVWGAVFN